MKDLIKLITNLLFIIIFASCNSRDESVGHGDVLTLHGEMPNAERLDQFILNVGKHTKDKLRVVTYTTEGAALYHDFEYDGEVIKYRYDRTNDNYGKEDVTNEECNNLIKITEGSKIVYWLEDCTGENGEIALFRIWTDQ